jgi:F0F1-type ATP synthase membrane subunit c/vacuolar-type H+-ATPase subunit K
MNGACGIDLICLLAPTAMGVYFLSVSDFPAFRSRRLHRHQTIMLGVLGLCGAGLVAVVAVVEGLLNFLGGTGIEGRSRTPEHAAEDRRLFLFFLVPKLIALFGFLAAVAVICQFGRLPSRNGDDHERRDRGA